MRLCCVLGRLLPSSRIQWCWVASAHSTGGSSGVVSAICGSTENPSYLQPLASSHNCERPTCKLVVQLVAYHSVRFLVAILGHDLTRRLLLVLCLSCSALYSTHMGSNRGGLLSSAADFFELFGNGIRGGQRRFFTYVLCEDSFRLVSVTLT